MKRYHSPSIEYSGCLHDDEVDVGVAAVAGTYTQIPLRFPLILSQKQKTFFLITVHLIIITTQGRECQQVTVHIHKLNSFSPGYCFLLNKVSA